jgi:hypothetical protein
MTNQACTYPIGLMRRACGRASVTSCVYCGEPFCETHGVRGEDYQDVCHRRACATKLHDLELHLAWRAQVIHSNRVSVCAEFECGERMRHACSQCRLLFCEVHVREHDVKDMRTVPPQKIRVLVCAHCIERRKVWE